MMAYCNAMRKLMGAIRVVEDGDWKEVLYENFSSNGVIYYQQIYCDFQELSKVDFIAGWASQYSGSDIDGTYLCAANYLESFNKACAIVATHNKLLEDIM
jgi:hypothetical protein